MSASLSRYECEVMPAWLDYNDHMNVAYYSIAFDEGGEELVKLFGMGLDYTSTTQNSWMVLEAHLTYQREARRGDRLRIESRVLDFNSKLAHLYQEMFRGEELLATQEQLVLHVSLETRRAARFPAAILERIAALHAAHREISIPSWVGRRIAIKPRST